MNIYFSGIGGAGLSPLAQLALDCGFQVSGSDVVASLLTEVLLKRGVSVTIGQSYEEIAAAHAQNPIDWIVVTSALKPDHPHYKFAQDQGIKISKRHDLINLILQEKNLKLIAVAGTHGKTTTTAMIVWLFKELNLPVSYSIGSNISFGPSAQYQEGSEFFVYEADEFDRNFLNFKPYISVITSLDYDHPDTYPSQADYFDSFKEFCNLSQILVSHDDILNKLGYYFDSYWKFYRETSDIAISGTEIRGSKKPDFIVITDWSYLQNYSFRLDKIAGSHNRLNAILSIKAVDVALSYGDKFDDYIPHLEEYIQSFPGTQRRFEKLAPNLYSDYAHHPAEIAATLQMAREVQSLNLKAESNGVSKQEILKQVQDDNSYISKLVVVYQPHQNIRQHEAAVQVGYEHCFDAADKVYWLPTYLSRENPDLEILTPEYLSGVVQKAGLAEVAKLNDELALKIKKHLKEGDLVVVMGAGSVDEWTRNLAKENAQIF